MNQTLKECLQSAVIGIILALTIIHSAHIYVNHARKIACKDWVLVDPDAAGLIGEILMRDKYRDNKIMIFLLDRGF